MDRQHQGCGVYKPLVTCLSVVCFVDKCKVAEAIGGINQHSQALSDYHVSLL